MFNTQSTFNHVAVSIQNNHDLATFLTDLGDQQIQHRVAVVGVRDFFKREFIFGILEALTDQLDFAKRPFIISGGDRGTDTIAERFAESRSISMMILRADWEAHGRRAGYVRNEDIVKEATHMLAFWNGEAAGTEHAIRQAQIKGIPVFVIPTQLAPQKEQEANRFLPADLTPAVAPTTKKILKKKTSKAKQ